MTSFNVSTTAGFQSALAQAQAGDSILLAPGTYAGISIQNVVKSGAVTITSQNLANPAVLEQFSIANSSGLSFSHLEFSTVGTTDPNYVWRVSNSQNISWDSLTVVGNPSQTPWTNPTAFLIQGSSNINITNSSFSNLLNGINEANNNHVNISGNNFQQMGSDGVDNSADGFVTISNNTFGNFDPAPGAHADAIQFWTQGTTVASHDITITGNVYVRGPYAASTDAQGIFLSDEVGTLPYSNVTITNNTIIGGMYNGIFLGAAQNATVSNNTVLGYTDMESWIRSVNSSGVVMNNNVTQTYLFSGSSNVTQTNDLTANAVTPSAPTLANAGSATTYHAGGAADNIASISVMDTESPTLASATVAITGGFTAGDALNFTNQNGITGSYNASTGVLTLSGSESFLAYQSALQSITFSSSAADPTKAGADASRAVSFTVNDGAHSSNTLAATVNVAAAATASTSPLLSSSGSVAGYAVGGAAASVAHSLVVTDTASSTLASASVAISGGFTAGDALNFANQNGITGAYNATTGVLTLTGSASLAAYQVALDSVTFSSSATDPTHSSSGAADPSRTMSFIVNDGAHNSNSLTSNVTVAVWSLSPLQGGLNPSSQTANSTVTGQSSAQAAAATTTSAVTAMPAVTAVASADGFILGSAGHSAVLASALVAEQSILSGLGALGSSAPAARVMPLSDGGTIIAGDAGFHHTDFVLPLLGVHSSPSHSLLM